MASIFRNRVFVGSLFGLLFVCMFCLYSFALSPRLERTTNLELPPKAQNLTMHEGSSWDVLWTFKYTNAPFNLTDANRVFFTFAPTNGAFKQVITGEVFDAAAGIVLIHIAALDIATNGVFDWDINVSSNGQEIIKSPFGKLKLIAAAGGNATNAFPTSGTNIDLQGVTFINFPWVIPSDLAPFTATDVVLQAQISDLQLQTSLYLWRDGHLPMTGNLDMGSNSIINIATGSLVFVGGSTVSVANAHITLNGEPVVNASDTNQIGADISANRLGVTTNAARIAANLSSNINDRAQLDANLVSIAANLASNVSDRAAIDANIIAIALNLASNLADRAGIDANVIAIAANLTSNLADRITLDLHTLQIAANLASNVADRAGIDSNAADIAANLTSNLADRASIDANILGIAANLASNVADRASIDINIAGIAANLSSNLVDAAGIAANLASNVADRAGIDANLIAIAANLTSNLADRATLDLHTTQIAANLSSNLADRASIDQSIVDIAANLASNVADRASIDANVIAIAANLTSNLADRATLDLHTTQIAANLASNVADRVTLDLHTLQIAANLASNVADRISIDINIIGISANLASNLANLVLIDVNAVGISNNLITNIAQEARMDGIDLRIDSTERRELRNSLNITLNRFEIMFKHVQATESMVAEIPDTYADASDLRLDFSTNWGFDSVNLFLTNTTAKESVLFSTNFPQPFDPTNAVLLFLRSDLSPAVTNNVDFIASVSKDNGVTFFNVPLSNDAVFSEGLFDFTNESLHYLLDDDAPSDVLVDALGNTNGTLNGGNTEDRTVAGRIGNAISLDGVTDDFLIFGEIQALEGPTNTTAFSIAFWMRTDSIFSSVRPLFTYSLNNVISANTDLYMLQRSGTTVGWAYGFGGEPLITINLNDLDWHHFVFVNDSSIIRVYVDGKLRSQAGRQGLSFGPPNQNLHFGDDLNVTFMTGSYDDIRIFPRTVRVDEVLALFNSGNGTQSESGAFPTLVVSGSAVLLGSGTNIVYKVQTANSNNIQLKATAVILE